MRLQFFPKSNLLIKRSFLLFEDSAASLLNNRNNNSLLLLGLSDCQTNIFMHKKGPLRLVEKGSGAKYVLPYANFIQFFIHFAIKNKIY
jgi:hypothetical protein